MKISDFESICEVDDDFELESALSKRYGECANEFWLTKDAEKYPTMSISVRDDLASLHYFVEDREPGFRSVGHVGGLEPGGFSTFFISPTEESEVFNDSIVPLAHAVKAAKEFLRSSALPSAVEWLKL